MEKCYYCEKEDEADNLTETVVEGATIYAHQECIDEAKDNPPDDDVQNE